MPAELAEVHSGAPIDYDDLLDFHLTLKRDDWFGSLLEMVEASDRQHRG